MIITLSIIFLVIGLTLWFIFGKDNRVVPVVSFYPPEDISLPEASMIFNDGQMETGAAYNQTSTKNSNNTQTASQYCQSTLESFAMCLYLKGWTKLTPHYHFQSAAVSDEEIKKMTPLEKACYDIFLLDEDLLYSTKKANYADVLKIMSTMSPYDQLMTSLKKKYFGNINVFVAWILLLMPIILLSFFLNNVVFGFCIFGAVCSIVGILSIIKAPPFIKIMIVAFCIPMISAILHSLLAGFSYTYLEIIITLSSAIILCFLIFKLPKRTPLGDKYYGQLLGFKNFLEKVEVPQLNELMQKDTDYFLKILPYAIELGIVHENYRKELYQYLNENSENQVFAFVAIREKSTNINKKE